MSDAPAWPGEPGFPPDPSVYGKYWLWLGGYIQADWLPFYPGWHAGWKISNKVLTPEHIVESGWTFGGPLLTPAEVAQREREAELRGFEQAVDRASVIWARDGILTHEELLRTDRWQNCLRNLRDELARRRAEAGT